MACDIWLRRDYLIRHGQTPDEPPCGHDARQCPVPADARRLGESEVYPGREPTEGGSSP